MQNRGFQVKCLRGEIGMLIEDSEGLLPTQSGHCRMLFEHGSCTWNPLRIRLRPRCPVTAIGDTHHAADANCDGIRRR